MLKLVAIVPIALLSTVAGAQAQTAPAAPPPVAVTPAPAPLPAMAPTQPVALFKAVCIDGIARLSRKWATATSYPAIPAAAQAALGQPVPNVPNPVFQISGGDEYLIVPAPDSAMPFAMGCAVVWKGDDLAAANKLVPAPPAAQVTVTASAKDGWTVLKAMPTPTNPKPATGVR